MSDSDEPKSWREPIKNIKLESIALCAFIERKCEQLSKRLDQWDFLDICGHIGRFGVIVSIIAGLWVYVIGADERRMQAEDQRKAKHYQAWQVINSAKGQESNAGRIDALQDLANDNVSLALVDLSNAYLNRIH